MQIDSKARPSSLKHALATLALYPELEARFVRIGAAVEVVELEEQVWRGLDEIAALEGITLDELCTLVHLTYLRGMSLDTGLRVYAVNYYRELERA